MTTNLDLRAQLDRIAVYRPSIDEDDIEAVAAALRRGWLGLGADVSGFELAVHDAIGAPAGRSVIALSTGSAALHVALLVAGVGPGDEVVLPSLSHLGDVQAVLGCGAEPVFCDVDEATMCATPELVEPLIGPRTKAIMALDYGCYLCDGEAFAALAQDAGVTFVRDAAHSFGSAEGGRPVGNGGGICVFSFDPVKAFTAVDAGLLVTENDEQLRAAQQIRLLGSDQPPAVMYRNARTWDYDAVRLGYRYHLSNIHAALGTAQLAKVDRVRQSRQMACIRYGQRLASVDAIIAPRPDVTELCPFLYFVRVPGGHRDPLRAWLAERGIDTGVHWRPAHRHTYFQQFRQGSLEVTERAGDELVTLPVHSDMPLDLIDRVCDEIEAYFTDQR